MDAPLRVLRPGDARRIHEAALRVLEETGMLVDHETALELLDGAGARVDARTRLVRFPPDLVEAKLALVPRALTYHGLDPAMDVTLTLDGDIYGRVPGGAPGYVDLETGQTRRARIADWAEFARLFDALPNVHVIATLHCGDVPEATADLHSLRTLLLNQRKCVVHNAFSLTNHRAMVDMLLAVAGSREALEARPFLHHMLSPISPLYLNEDDTAQLLLACEYGIPTDVPVMPIAGITSPITLAGCLVQAVAEFLGTMTLAQVARPGHRMPFFVDPVAGDMRTGNALFGAPEVGLLVAAISQIGTEVYGLPSQAIGLDSDGFSFGDTMFQKAQNLAFQAMAGGKLIIGAGNVEATMALSPTQLVVDDELMAIARRWVRGITVSDETLAVDALARVGPRGDFMSDDLTIAYLRSGELIDPELFERGSRETWESKGGRTLEERARDKARAIIASHQVDPLPDEVVREIDTIVARADGALART